MDSPSAITLKELIYSSLNKANLDNTEYDRFERISIDLIRKFHLHHFQDIKIVEIEMDVNHRVKIPDDCLWVKAIGYPKHGRLWTITRDDKIYQAESMVSGVLSSDSDTLENIQEHPKYGYAARGRNKYGFTINYSTRELIITGTPLINITIHYLSSGLSMDGDSFIPAEAINALQAAIIFDANAYDAKSSNAYTARLRQNYKSELYELRKIYTTHTTDEWHDMFLRTQTQVVTR